MKKLTRALIILAAFLACSIPAFSAANIQFEKQEIDFGSVPSGNPITVDFKFTNTGDADLEIKNVHAGCGCTKAQALDKTIAPGKSSAIEATFNGSGFSGKITKSVSVQTNDPANQTISLKLTGSVATVAKILPERVNFGTIQPGSTCTKTIEIIPTDSKAFTITKITSSGKTVSVSRFRKIEDKDGVRWILDVVIKAESKPGRIYENLTISAKSGKDVRLNALVYGNVAG